jgi:hypothetical protein
MEDLTMMSGRRLVAAVALAILAPLGLAACQTDPAVAAYVDDTEISEERVSGVVNALRASYEGELEEELASLAGFDNVDDAQLADYRAEGREEIERQLTTARDRVLLFLVLTEISVRFAEDEGFGFPEPDVAGIAEQTDLPEDHPYVEVVAEFNAVVGTVVQARAEPGEPTEADQREVYENLRIDGAELDIAFEDVQEFLTPDVLAVPVGIRDLLVRMVERVEVRVQPGYHLEYQVPVSVGPATSHLAVLISAPSSVQDAS